MWVGLDLIQYLGLRDLRPKRAQNCPRLWSVIGSHYSLHPRDRDLIGLGRERREGGGGSEPNKGIDCHGSGSEGVGGAVPRPDAPQLRLRYLCCCRRLRRRAGPISFPHFFSSFSDAICVRMFSSLLFGGRSFLCLCRS